MARIGVVVFPGSNCDRDVYHVFHRVLDEPVQFHWHEDPIRTQYRLVILPGGFSYGDYLRAGAMAKISRAVASLGDFIANQGFVLGICNGFQILVEAGFLPGAMMRNRSLCFQCEDAFVRVESNESPFLTQTKRRQILRMPIAHSEGRYVVDPSELERLRNEGCVALRYCGPKGEDSDEFNVNGSMYSIAGLTNREGNVLGLMPHPERCSESLLGNTDGLKILQSIQAHL